MSDLPDLSAKIEPFHQLALRELSRAAAACGADWFVSGATARDWLLHFIHGIAIERPTRDLDFGIAVADWHAFDRIAKSIRAGGEFLPDERSRHRFNYRASRGLWIDIVPFGPLADNDGSLAWPPDHAEVLDVTGFAEAYRGAVDIKADSDLVVRVASLPGQMLLKLFAWRDRHRETGKDARDIRVLLTRYEEAGNRDRVFDDGAMAAEDHDAARAAARLLGRDVRRLLPPDSHAHQALARLLDAELDPSGARTLVADLSHGTIDVRRRAELDEGRAFTDMLGRMASFRAGIYDPTSPPPQEHA